MPDRNPNKTVPTQVASIVSDEHALAVAREFVESIRGGAARRDLEKVLPHQEFADFTRSGLGILNVPRDLGGPEVSYRTLLETIRLIASADSSIAQIALTHWSGIEMLRRWAPPALRERLLRRVILGDLLGNASKDARPSRSGDRHGTFLSLDENGARMSGEKAFATGSLLADWLYVMCSSGKSAGSDLVAFIDVRRAGLAIHDNWDGVGQRTTASGNVTLDSVFLDPGEYFEMTLTDSGESALFSGVSHLLHSGIELGLGDGALRETLDILRTEATPPRGSDAMAAVEDPLTLSAVGELVISQHTAERAAFRAADTLDAAKASDRPHAGEVLFAVCEAKIVTERFALNSATTLFELCGSRVATRSRNLDRYWRDARTHSLHDASRWKTVTLGQAALNGRRPDAFTLGHPFTAITPQEPSVAAVAD
ncbi:acyl-CoA dehydrogenase family protein [Celeribacter indicus]|uniref:Putative acyl-CoA dehydrogenase n=1 Tax=Celeribacter indicus TaxID=1208324 RepID=A0A0B5E6Y9_9RHOB|nr:acyl-CoA dehydrogenase family protein [Celeribacter indicus]AJE48801.1 putative acyl-CoA dehydrogenase [Celeribacter indicus]SDW37766.1 Acyl-CoA dehydrogenase [Celeribacter indicus]